MLWRLQRYDLDTFGYVRENNKKAREKVLEIISLYDLIDPWREINQDKLKYTWFSSKPPRQMTRLDFFLITPDLWPRLVKTDIMHGYHTNHSFIGMSLDVGLVKRGNGYWKMNTSLLYDVEYIQLVKNEIKNTLNCYKVENDQNFEVYSIDFQLLFEVVKLNIR